MICETKIDDSIPIEPFIIENYSAIYRLHKNKRGVEKMLIVKDNLLTSSLDRYCFPNEIEIFCIEINL